ncbi:MAG: hypothetical protein HY077_03975 [Elusimicrobia bacterium]|nr:hypothetical protein [Elusimicrobiota bacterium]
MGPWACALLSVAASLSAQTGSEALSRSYQEALKDLAVPPGESIPAPAAAVDHMELRQGLRLLYKNVDCRDARFCLNPANENAMVANALEFKSRFDALALSAGPPSVTWRRIGWGVEEFEFPSLMRRGSGHPSDTVRGFVYFPQNYDKCGAKYPATLILQKLSDKLDSERDIAKLGASSDRGVVMAIYLPHFGPRRGATSFITKDPEEFEANMLQALLDIHQSYLVLKALPGVKTDDIGLMGLSLGAMVGLVSAGIDPVFDRYGTNVGGGDLANIVTYRKSGDVDSQTGSALKEIDWSVDQARFYLSRFDAITWSLNAKGKTFLMINALADELISKPLSLEPLLEGYRAAGSTVRTITHKGTHVFRAKEVGYWDTLSKVMLPMLDFMGLTNWEARDCLRGN